ncbi:MAG TPA: AtpZ/AtpI family protein [Firmicutes bacterium]|jgi:ATP synthase protein I|nr:AtpZ/AtpI family protein [Bacillota bacterium]HOQ23923.1 AtpZ/AtpI family protein [Bacillota bacterium]HPT67175.1 AtpZ/AtpI family protein [Bacillota bacterium]
MEDPRQGPRLDPELLRHLKFYGTIGMDIASGTFLGFAVGTYLDSRYGTSPVWSAVCLLLGATVGFYGVFRLVMREVKRR